MIWDKGGSFKKTFIDGNEAAIRAYETIGLIHQNGQTIFVECVDRPPENR
jgi:hypothetical protein